MKLTYGVNGMSFFKSVLGSLHANKDVCDNSDRNLSGNTAKNNNLLDLASKVLKAPKGKTHIFATGQAGFIIGHRSVSFYG